MVRSLLLLVGFASLFVPGAATAQCVDYGNYIHREGILQMGSVVDLEIVGTLAYLARSDDGMAVVDVADPSDPVLLGELDLSAGVNAVAIVGDHAYFAAGGAGLIVVDISDPTAPVQVGNLGTPGGAADVAVYGGHAYIADSNYSLQVLDVTDPTAPLFVRRIVLPGNTTRLALTGHHLYVGNGDIYTFNLGDPANPLARDLLTMDRDVWDLAVAGDVLYAAKSWFGVDTIDISDRENPVVLANIDPPDTQYDVAVSGDRLYTTGDGLCVIDVADPAAPVLLGRTEVAEYIVGLRAVGDLVYLAASDAGLVIIDTTVPYGPARIGEVDLAGDPEDVVVAGNHAYVGSRSLGLYAVDVTAPAHPAVNDSLLLSGLEAMDLAGDHACVAQSTGEFRTIDVSTPTDLQVVGLLSLPGMTSPRDLVVADDLAYVVEGGSYPSTLRVIDVSSPTLPQLLGAIDFLDSPADVDVAGGVACVASYAGLQIFDVSDPAAPSLLVDMPVKPSYVDVVGTLAYVTVDAALSSHGELWILDISTPASPVLLGSEVVPLRDASVRVDGETAYLTHYNRGFDEGGMCVIDVSDPTAPLLVGYADDSLGKRVDVAGGLVYSVGPGLRIFPAHCSSAYADCNDNGIDDALEIAAHPSLDFNGDGILDSCQQGQGISGVPAAAGPFAVLHDACPNPFNPRTVVAFDLKAAAAARLRVYDLAGRLVRTLMDGETARAGRTEVAWAGRDDAGNRVASGIYFCRLEVGAHVQTRKLVLMK